MGISLWSALAPAEGPAEGALARTSGQARAVPLQLVHAHEHTWQLRTVEYDDALEVRRYECESCDDVMFR